MTRGMCCSRKTTGSAASSRSTTSAPTRTRSNRCLSREPVRASRRSSLRSSPVWRAPRAARCRRAPRSFENVIATAGLEPGGDQHGAGWGDLDGDGRPDLYVGLGAERGRGTKTNRLYRNLGGRFVDIAGAAGATDPRGRARGVSWVDYDRDGRLDVFVANYASPNVLLHNAGDGTFEDRAQAAGLARP